MGAKEIELTPKQLAKATALPEEIEITEKDAEKVITVALEALRDGKADSKEIMELLKLPDTLPITKDFTLRMGQVLIQILKTKAGARQVRLTPKQVFQAVSQLSWKDKAKLKNILEIELELRLKRTRQRFEEAWGRIGAEYEGIGEAEVDKDVLVALSKVRKESRTKSRS